MRLWFLALLLIPSSLRAEEGWRHVTTEDGVAVTSREVPGRGFPTFRGVGAVDASIFDILAVISDLERYPHWMPNCRAARQLRKVNEFEYYVYSRIHAPWPVSDRDAAYHSKVLVKLDPRAVVEIRFWAEEHAAAPPVKGVVRMVSLQGFYKLTALSPTRTLMDYQVDADPRGLIPKWIAKMASKKLPLENIRAIRKRAVVTRGWYWERVKRWQALEQQLRQKQLRK